MTRTTKLTDRNIAITIGTLEEQNAASQARKYGLSGNSVSWIIFDVLNLIFSRQKPQKYEVLRNQRKYGGVVHNEYSYYIGSDLKTIYKDREYILQVIREYCEDTNRIFGDYGK